MAKTDLDTLVVRVEADLKQFEQGMDTATKRVQVLDKTAGAATTGATRFAASTDRIGKTAKQAGGGMGELRESFASLVSQMAGVHPVSGKLLSVFGSLAVGSGVMIGVLGGLAALGAAFKFLTRDITAAKEASEKAFATLDKLAEKARSMGGIAELNTAIIEAEERLKKITPLLAALRAQRELGGGTDPSSAERRLADEFAELTFKIGEANKRIKEIEAEKIKANNDAYAKTVRAEAAAHTEAAAAVKEYHASLADTVAELRAFLGLQKRISLVLPSAGTVTAPGQPSGGASGDQAREFVFGAEPVLPAATQGGFAQLGAQARDLAQAFTPLGIASAVLGTVFSKFGTIMQPIIDILASALTPVLKVLVTAFSYVTQGIGWFVRAIGKAVNFLLPGNPANGLVRFGQNMIDASKAAREFEEASQAAAAQMRNVPLIFSTALAGYRVGMGDTGRTAVARTAGNLNIGTINVNVDSASTWAGIRQQMTTAASGGDPLARALLKAG